MKLKRKTILASLIICLVATTLVSASLLSYFGKVTTNVDVTQAIQIDGQDGPITHEIYGIGGDQHIFDHYIINNNGNRGATLFWDHSVDRNDGIHVSVKETPKCLGELIIETFDVQNPNYNDGFQVQICYAKMIPVQDPEILGHDPEILGHDPEILGHDPQKPVQPQKPPNYQFPSQECVFVYEYQAQQNDQWITHEIDLLKYQIPIMKDYTIKIIATGVDELIFNAVAVKSIELYTDTGYIIDSVDIGDETSETGHNLNDWTRSFDDGENTYRYVFARGVIDKTASLDMFFDWSVLPDMGTFDIERVQQIDITIVYDIDFMCPSGQYIITSELKLVE